MTRAYLMLAAGDDRQHAGNLGYSYDPHRNYVWDNTVANHARPSPGDVIALWNKNVLLGASVIDRIVIGKAKKERLRCPLCNKTQLKARSDSTPKYRCYRQTCHNQFDTPKIEIVEVTTYGTDHEAGWVDLYGILRAADLRELCVEPSSIQSIRELRLDAFRQALKDRDAEGPTAILGYAQVRHLPGGHKTAMVRVRLGQNKFRKSLLDRYGSICAITGKQPVEALDAAHLYSYAALGEHHEHGGLLLRKDLHRLFDLGWIAIEPNALTISLSQRLKGFPDYASLEGARLVISPPPSVRIWLKSHWREHRSI